MDSLFGSFFVGEGWFKIHRSLIDHPAFRDAEERWAFVELLALAAWQPMTVRYKDRVINLKRGQLAISIRDFARRLGWHPARAQRFFETLKNRDMADTASDTGVNVVTIRNYCIYQDLEESKRYTDKSETDTGPIQDRYTEKEVKEVKKESKEAKASSSKPNGFDPSPFVETWNDICGQAGLSRVTVLRDARKMKAIKRWREDFGASLERWGDFCRRVATSDFLAGRKTDWKASFDWVLEPRNFVKINEGNYDNGDGHSGDPTRGAARILGDRHRGLAVVPFPARLDAGKNDG